MERGPLLARSSRFADFGARTNRKTVQLLPSEGPLTETLPFSTESFICEKICSTLFIEASAALQAVTEYVSLSQPCTCTPPFTSDSTRSGPSGLVMERSSERISAARSKCVRKNAPSQ